MMEARIAGFLYRWRIVFSVALVAGAVAFSPRILITDVENDVSAWFDAADPVFRAYDRLRREFGGTQPLIVAIRSNTPEPGAPPAAGVFTRARLDFLERVTTEIERVPSVRQVQSLATTTILRALPPSGDSSGDLELQPLLDGGQRSPEEARALALGEPLIRPELISDDGLTTSIVVTFDEDRLSGIQAEVIDRIHTIVDSALPPGLAAFYNGSLEIVETYNRITITNHRRFFPTVFAFTLIAIYAMFRSIGRTLVAMIAILVSVAWTLGLYQAMGFRFTILSAMLTPLVVVLAVSDDIHLIQYYDGERRHASHQQAFANTVAYLLFPLLAASATTALGLLSLATSDIGAVKQFGIGAAVGVMVDCAISLVFVPTLLGWVNVPAGGVAHERLAGLLRRTAAFVTVRPRIVLAAAMIIAVIAAAGISRLRIDTNHVGFFGASHPISRSAAVIDRELAGVASFQVLLEGEPGSMQTPDTLERIDRLAQRIRQLPHVRKVTSAADYVKKINQVLHDGDASAAVIPDQQSIVSQELFLFALGDEGRRELERVVSSDFSIAQMTVRLPSMDSGLIVAQIEAAERLANAIFSESRVRATVTGSGQLFSALDHYLVKSQLAGFATAFLTVFATLFVIFRSVKFGLLSILPNTFPILVVLGAMGWLDISVNVATVMLASVALGIVDDDTVHFIGRLRREIAAGASVAEAIAAATIFEGRAALTTAIVATCGFAILVITPYKPTAWFGGLLALTMTVAFLSEVFLLPAAIRLMPRLFGAMRTRDTSPAYDREKIG